MKKALLLCYIFINANLLAQKQMVIEPSILECQYKHIVINDTVLNKPRSLEDLMILRIGQNTSQFFSHYTFYSDSLLNDPNGKKLSAQLTLEAIRTRDHSKRPFARTTHDYIYKRYPEGKITTTSTLNLQRVIFDEPYESQNWSINDSLKHILGYECQQAECYFRGRKYYAWFTPEIAVNDGPWKFNGLPGLILEVYDKDKHYYYEIIGIYKTALTPVTFYNLYKDKFVKTTRLKFLEALRKYKDNSLQQIKASMGINLNPNDRNLSKSQNDFQEVDYHQK